MTGAPSLEPGTASPRSLSVANLSVAYGTGAAVLSGLDLELRRGEHVAIVGPSGAGKTTLLRCVAGTQRGAHGLVRPEGRVASIHQDLRLVSQTSALANVLHGALARAPLALRVGGFPRAERLRAQALLARVGLAGLEARRVSQLSGGEQQRVAIARALMQDPAILLADEPVAALDDARAEQVLALLTRLASEDGLTLVTVLHQRALAARFADRVLELRDGPLELARFADAGGEPCTACASRERDAGGPAVAVPEMSRLGMEPGLATAATAPFAPRAALRDRDASRTPEGTAAVELPRFGVEGSLLGGRPWRFALVAGAALLLHGWSLAGLELEARQLERAPRNLLAFARAFVPRSFDSLAALPWSDIGRGLRETLQMSILATTLGILGSLPLAVLAARNLAPRWLSQPTRQLLNAVRTVPSIIWAMLFVAAVGLGPFAGILALFCYTLGYLTKFFYEAFEATGRATQDALRELGASGMQRFAHAVWPAALPAFASSSLFMLEYNVRSASVLGVVDAGGIGVQLHELLIYRDFPGAAACLGLAVVILLDALSSRVRDWAVRR